MSASSETIIYSVDDAIAEFRLNRPHRLNAVTQQLYDELNLALDRAQDDRHVRVVVITGEGRAFCVGTDLQEHKQGRTAFDRRQYLRGEHEVCKRIHKLRKPVISAVNGFAHGAEAAIAIASDFLVMAAKAKIGRRWSSASHTCATITLSSGIQNCRGAESNCRSHEPDFVTYH